MTSFLELLFWSSTGIIAYATLLYPVGIIVAAHLFGKEPVCPSLSKTDPRDRLPLVSVILTVCNEGEVITQKLENTLAFDYPADLLEVIIAADEGITDCTLEVARSFENRGVVLCSPCSGERGKNVSMDAAVRLARGSLLLFTDGTAILETSTLRVMVDHFADESVGCVAGRLFFRSENGSRRGNYSTYWRMEHILLAAQGRLGYLPVAAGGMHLMFKDLYRPVANHLIRDIVDPAQVAGAGYRVVFAKAARACEEPWVGTSNILEARIRMTQRSLSSVASVMKELLPNGRYLAVLILLSNKVLRWLLWLPMLGALVAACGLARSSNFYAVMALIQLVFYALSLLGIGSEKASKYIPGLSFLSFAFLNLFSMAIAGFRWANGGKRSTWRNAESVKETK